MTYAVIWDLDAEQELADLWLAATDHDAVNFAAHRIDQVLAIHPLQFGQPRGSSVRRYATVGPLGVLFEIIEDDKKVLVHGITAIS